MTYYPATRGSHAQIPRFIAPPHGELLYLTIGGTGSERGGMRADLAAWVNFGHQNTAKENQL